MYCPMTRARPYDRDTALDAAMTLFWQKGFHATSLKDLEGALQMKPGSIYAAFHSKQALYLEALDRYLGISRNTLATLAAREASPLTALAQFLRRFGTPDLTKRGPAICMIVKTLIDATKEEPEIQAAAKAHLATMTGDFAALFQRAQEIGELPASAKPHLLARKFQMSITALRFEAQRSGGDEDLMDLAEEMARDIERLRIQ